MVKFKEIVYTRRNFEKAQKEQERMDPTITTAVDLGNKIVLTNKMVISRWRLKEIVEDLYDLELQFSDTSRSDNLPNNCSHYQVLKKPDGRPILVRVRE